MDAVRIQQLTLEQIDDVGPLFREMVEHHRRVVDGAWPVRQAHDAWLRRRAEYAAWLAAPGTWMLLASTDDLARAGYLVLRLHESGASWDIGDSIMEVESLAVADGLRGRGIGAALIAAARDIAREQRVTHWLVAVVDANADALRFYEREGFRPYYRQLLGEL